jgi:hypothetical protein
MKCEEMRMKGETIYVVTIFIGNEWKEFSSYHDSIVHKAFYDENKAINYVKEMSGKINVIEGNGGSIKEYEELLGIEVDYGMWRHCYKPMLFVEETLLVT